MGDRDRRIAAALLAGGVAFALVGQAYFTWRGDYFRDGVVFYALAVILWGAAVRRLGTGPWRLAWPLRLLRAVAKHPVRSAFLCVGAALAVGAGIAAVRTGPEVSFAGHLVAWMLGLASFLAALTPMPGRDWGRRLARWAREHWMELLGLTVLLLAALAARAVALEVIPANFGGDEGTQALAGLRLVEPPLGNPFSTGWYSVPTLSFLAYGLVTQLFGSTVAGARVLSTVIGTATVLATFLLARELMGRWVGWVAAVLVAFGHYGVHFSRLASNQVADGLLGAVTLYLLVRSLQRERGRASPLGFGLAGVVLGLSWYGYFGARLATVVVVLYLVWRALKEPRFLARQGQGLLFLVAGAVLAASPLFFHYLAYPREFLSRYNQVSIFASGWLKREVVVTGRGATVLLLEQFWKSVSAFHVTPDPTFWYHPETSLLDPVSGVFFVLGLVAAVVHARRPANGLSLIWFWSFILLGWTLTENPPSSQRAVGVVPVVAVLTALGLVEMVRLAQRLALDRRKGSLYGPLLVALVLSVAAAVNLWFYFGVYTPRRVYGNPTAEVADVLCDALEAREGVPHVYFDGAPMMYWDFGAIAYRLRDVEGRDFSPDAGLESVDRSRGALFVVLAERLPDLAGIQAAFPEGSVARFDSETDGRLLFALYEVPPRRDS